MCRDPWKEQETSSSSQARAHKKSKKNSAVCRYVVQCVAGCCRVLQVAAVCFSVLQCVAVGINGIRLMRSCLTRKVICMHPAVTTSSIELVESAVSALHLQ